MDSTHLTHLNECLSKILNNQAITFPERLSYYNDVFTLCKTNHTDELIKTLDQCKGKNLTVEQYNQIRNIYSYLQRMGAYQFDYDLLK